MPSDPSNYPEYRLLQNLLASYAHLQDVPEGPPRGVVERQDALDALLQVAMVLDEKTQRGGIPVERGVHAAGMLLVAHDYLRSLPSALRPDGSEPLTADLQRYVDALRAWRAPDTVPDDLI